MRVTSVGAQTGDLFESELRAGGNNQVVVLDLGAVVQFDLVIVGMQALCAVAMKLDPVFFHQLGQVYADLAFLAPANRNPGIGWREFESVGVPDEHDVVLLADLFAQLVNLRDAANAGSQYNYFSHVPLLKRATPGSA